MNKQELITNKQELISKYELLKNSYDFKVVATDDIISDLKRLDEPEKVTIPQFVAEYIEESRLKGWDLLASMCFVLNAKNKKTTKWFYLGENKNIFALAWIFGYTVEVDEEKKYKITLLNRNDGDLYLINQNAGVSDKYGHFSPVVLLFTKETNFSEECYTLTKKEVASNGFGWVFDSPGFQIEEVE